LSSLGQKEFIPIHELRKIVVRGSTRWLGHVRLEGDREETPMLVLEHDARLIAVPQRCPHQGYDLTEALVTEDGTLICPHHGQRFPLDCSFHFALAVERQGDDFLMHLPDEDDRAPAIEQNACDEHPPAPPQTLAAEPEMAFLRAEVEALRAANRSLEARIQESMSSMDSMLREVEGRRRDIELKSVELESLAELVTRITESIHDIMLVTGLDGRVLRASKSALTFFGVPAEQLVGKNVDDLLDPADLERLRPLLLGQQWSSRPLLYELIYADESFEEEVVLRTLADRPAAPEGEAKGPRLCHLLHGSVLYDQRGKEEGLILLASDISSVKQREELTRERETQKSLDLMRDALGNISQGITMYDADLKLVVWNQRFFELLDLPEHLGAVGTPFEAFMRYNAERGEYGPGDVEEIVKARMVRAHALEAHTFERERADGRFVEISGNPLPNGSFISTYTDITERKRNEINLREFNTTLERTVAERTEALQKALNDLGEVIENLEQTQDELVRSEKLAALGSMVAGVAHELNTPIGNSLMVASHLVETSMKMKESLKTGLKKSMLDEFLANTDTAGDVLVRNLGKAAELVSSFKQVAVDQTSSKRRTFKLAGMVAEVVTSLGPTIKMTPYIVEQNISTDISMDTFPGPLGQVVTNLINNGIIHGFDGRGHGHIRIEAVQSEDLSQVVLNISDDGKGIPPAVLPRIFDPFFTTKLGQGGSGLGLNIVHNMVFGILGGRITADSVPGEGSCFTLVLPLSAPQQDATQSKPA
jgi:signal transduction histidine kinase/PAS domain-containing protein/nitrite reductase/ring-hydroxylating ferredoxin subunit